MPENILDYTEQRLKEHFSSKGMPAYRAEQVFGFIHKKHTDNFRKIRLIPEQMRRELGSEFIIGYPKTITKSSSGDGTVKFLFEFGGETEKDKARIETVLIPDKERTTICLSTQAGCNAACGFCATGKIRLKRNLTAGEIAGQVYGTEMEIKSKPTNIVYMGMGEPFLNYESVLESLKILTSPKGAGIPSRRITVSTIGFRERIRKFADDITLPENKTLRNTKLALSLHSTDSGIREKLIPVSKIHSLPRIYEELIYYYRKTGTKVTYEYIHFPGLNDTENDVKRLSRLSGMIPCNINIIPFHPVSFELKPPLDKFNEGGYGTGNTGSYNSLSKNKLNDFIAVLRQNKIIVNLRKSSGVDIDAACGQLAASN